MLCWAGTVAICGWRDAWESCPPYSVKGEARRRQERQKHPYLKGCRDIRGSMVGGACSGSEFVCLAGIPAGAVGTVGPGHVSSRHRMALA